MTIMKGITIKLPEETLRRLRQEARATGRSVAAIVRDRVEEPSDDETSVYAASADLAGCLEGGQKAAANARQKFKRS